MQTSIRSSPSAGPEQHLDPETRAFYSRSLTSLEQAGVPFLVGGAYAFERYTGIARHTKDLDIFVRESDCQAALAALTADGCRGEGPFSHWLAKAYCGDYFVDLIYGSGNGLAPVDDDWFTHAVDETVLAIPVQIVPAEEMIWQKALIMERERFDGADVAHLLRARADRLDWPRLLDRFGEHWQVLLSHLILFSYIYPEEQAKVPAGVLHALLGRQSEQVEAAAEHPDAPAEHPAVATDHPDAPTEQLEAADRPVCSASADDLTGRGGADGPVCHGTVLSRTQYVVDVEQWGYQDGRIAPVGNMTPAEAACWTEAGLQEIRVTPSAG